MTVRATSPPSSTEPSSAPRRRRGLLVVGLVLVAGGLVLLGYVAWQLYGTNVVAHRRQEALVRDLRDSWTSPREERLARSGKAFALLRIPRFGASYEMPVLEGTSDDVLARGFGHFGQAAGPGQVGNYALAAHRITHGEPLRRMPELQPGDEVVVETRGAVYTYVLDTDPNDLVVPFTAGWVVDPFPVNPDGGVGPDPAKGRRLLTLTTCSELFHTDDRMIAFGHLESRRAKPAAG